ncbi:hypothetical protein PFISCL1PPCAC_26734, partial [Pristionchus fissidentatus]
KVFRCQCPHGPESWPVTYKVIGAERKMQAIRSSGRSLDRLCRRGEEKKKKKMPSPLCCLRIMHIRTAMYWIAYAEMMWITSQFAFWMAQLVVDKTSLWIVILGFFTVLLQGIIVYQLCRGVKYFLLPPIQMYQLGLLVRMFICIVFTALALFF